MIKKLFIYCTINLLVLSISCEIFSAINELEKLSVSEKIIIDELKILASQLRDDYVDRYERRN